MVVRYLLSSLFLFVISFCSAQYNALLWEISGNGLKNPSYLFGTMHTADSRIIKKSEPALPYLKKCKAFAMELDPEAVMPTELISGLMMGKGYSLKKMVTPEDYALLDSLVKLQMGVPLQLLDNVAPVFIATIIQQTTMGLSNGDEKGAPALDIYLHQEAKKQKKKLFGLETAAEQLTALNSLSFQEQADLLVENLREVFEDNNEGLKLVEEVVEEEVVEEEIEEVVEEEAEEEAEEEGLEEFEYKGNTYYKDSENIVYVLDDNDEPIPRGQWNEAKGIIQFYKTIPAK